MTDWDHERENYLALLTTQALLGNVSPDLYGVAIEVVGRGVKLYFLIREPSETLEEDFDDVVASLEVGAAPDEIEIHIEVTLQGSGPWPGRAHRMVFLRREI